VKASPFVCLILALSALAACSDGPEDAAEPAASTAPPVVNTAEETTTDAGAAPLTPEAQAEALSIREAADKAAALVEADAAAAQISE